MERATGSVRAGAFRFCVERAPCPHPRGGRSCAVCDRQGHVCRGCQGRVVGTLRRPGDVAVGTYKCGAHLRPCWGRRRERGAVHCQARLCEGSAPSASQVRSSGRQASARRRPNRLVAGRSARTTPLISTKTGEHPPTSPLRRATPAFWSASPSARKSRPPSQGLPFSGLDPPVFHRRPAALRTAGLRARHRMEEAPSGVGRRRFPRPAEGGTFAGEAPGLEGDGRPGDQRLGVLDEPFVVLVPLLWAYSL